MKGVRYIKPVHEDQVFVANQRAVAEETLPLFFFDGVIVESSSGKARFPYRMLIEYAIISVRVAGGSSTTLKFIVGDDIWEPEGRTVGTVTFGADTLYVRYNTPSDTVNPPVFDPLQWLRVDCTDAGAHEDVTVQFWGRRM